MSKPFIKHCHFWCDFWKMFRKLNETVFSDADEKMRIMNGWDTSSSCYANGVIQINGVKMRELLKK